MSRKVAATDPVLFYDFEDSFDYLLVQESWICADLDWRLSKSTMNIKNTDL